MGKLCAIKARVRQLLFIIGSHLPSSFPASTRASVPPPRECSAWGRAAPRRNREPRPASASDPRRSDCKVLTNHQSMIDRSIGVDKKRLLSFEEVTLPSEVAEDVGRLHGLVERGRARRGRRVRGHRDRCHGRPPDRWRPHPGGGCGRGRLHR